MSTTRRSTLILPEILQLLEEHDAIGELVGQPGRLGVVPRPVIAALGPLVVVERGRGAVASGEPSPREGGAGVGLGSAFEHLAHAGQEGVEPVEAHRTTRTVSRTTKGLSEGPFM
jgi:hypothetical protein